MRRAARTLAAGLALAFVVAAGAPPGLASDLSASGLVLDAGGRPAIGVPLVVTGPIGETTVFTDGGGLWTLYGLPPGDYQIVPVGDPGAPPFTFTVVNPLEALTIEPLHLR
ncbi:MAG TPA: carboxypeptidase-like regulatory domain-containing protein [Methylomirabilota bacterium]|nr:carboxypeptidase-like regulatory domain-containing protein [Methylomirabilota bacterium]